MFPFSRSLVTAVLCRIAPDYLFRLTGWPAIATMYAGGAERHFDREKETEMNSTGTVVVVIGVIIVLVGILRHFAHLAILGSLSHGSTILIVVGLIIAAAGYFLGRSRSAVV